MIKKLIPKDELKGEADHIGYWNNGRGGSHRVSIFDVKNSNGLNAMIGKAKHKNDDGSVLYRGQCRLYPHLWPSVWRDSSAYSSNMAKLSNNINKMFASRETSDFFQWKGTGVSGWELYIKTTYEAALQHYGGKTNCVDLVDNHWTALWFALNKYDIGSGKYQKNNFGNVEDDPESSKFIIFNNDHDTGFFKSYGYIFLYLAETSVPEVSGLYLGQITYTVDLRKALPAEFLRPVAQHGWVVRRKDENKSENIKKKGNISEVITDSAPDNKSTFSFDDNVVGILRINTELIDRMLGNGSLLEQENFFPVPKYDDGYRFLINLQKDGILYSDTLMEYK